MALSIEQLNDLTPEQMADKTLEELELEFGDGEPSTLEDDLEDDNQDNNDDNPDDEDNQDNDDNEPEDEDVDNNDNPDNQDPEEEENEDDPESDADNADDEEKKKDKANDAEVEKYKSFYEALTAPFTANGQTYELTNPSDFISLVQKGLNYNLKMNTIKPYMAAGTLLKEHDLLDVDKLAFLIDLHNKKPEAIAKLIKESGHDVYDLDEEKANNYQATPVNIPSDEVLALKEVIANNLDNTDFTAVYDAATAWDGKSQEYLATNPQLLETLAQHKANGVYDKIMQRVNVAINVRGDKTPVIELYDSIGRSMFEGNNANKAQANEQPPTKQPATKVLKRVDPRLEEKRKTLKSVKTAQNKSQANYSDMTEEQIYSLSPEEFAKIDSHLLKGR